MVQSTQLVNGVRLMDVRIPGGMMAWNLQPIHLEICVDILAANGLHYRSSTEVASAVNLPRTR